MAKRDYYEVLGVERNASEQAIKKAYRRLAMKHHPDRNPDDASSEEKFKEASEAAEVLMDAEKRQAYDQFGHSAVDGSGLALVVVAGLARSSKMSLVIFSGAQVAVAAEVVQSWRRSSIRP